MTVPARKSAGTTKKEELAGLTEKVSDSLQKTNYKTFFFLILFSFLFVPSDRQLRLPELMGFFYRKAKEIDKKGADMKFHRRKKNVDLTILEITKNHEREKMPRPVIFRSAADYNRQKSKNETRRLIYDT